MTSSVEVDPHLIQDHFDLVDAYERADLPAAKSIITTHNEHAKATQRAAILRLGGEV